MKKTILISALLLTTVSGISIANIISAEKAANISNETITELTTEVSAPNLEETQPIIMTANFTPVNYGTNDNNIEIYKLAGNFAEFISETSRAASNDGLSSAAKIDESVARSTTLTRASTIDGAKAYAVIAALRSSEFTGNIKSIANFGGKDALIAKLKSDPTSVRNIEGYLSARNFSSMALGSAYTSISKASAKINQAAYDLQLVKWSKIESPKEPRLNAVAQNWTKDVSFKPVSDYSFSYANGSNEPVNDKILVAAALVALGEGNEAINFLTPNSGKSCATRAYLNLRMCLAATRYPYEHTFCLAKHSYEEFNSCARSATK